MVEAAGFCSFPETMKKNEKDGKKKCYRRRVLKKRSVKGDVFKKKSVKGRRKVEEG